jgi:hypothetical protein
VHLVGDAVARPAEVDAVSLAGSLQVTVVVGVTEVGLQEIVVHILGRQFHPHPLHPQGLELQHGHGAGGVLEQGMIDTDGDLLAGHQVARDQVIGENLLGQVHGVTPSCTRRVWIMALVKGITLPRRGEGRNRGAADFFRGPSPVVLCDPYV